MPNAKRRVSRYLASLVAKSGLSQAEFSKKLGVNPSNMRRMICTGRVPRDRIRDFAKHLGVAVSDLKRSGVVEGEKARRRRSFTSETIEDDGYNLVPILRAVAKSGIKEVTFRQLRGIAKIVSRLNGPITPSLVKELIQSL